MGTMLQALGLTAAGEIPELLNLTNPEAILAIHRAYAESGSEYITANTFGANRLKMKNCAEIVRAGVENAMKTGKKVLLDIGPTGKLLKPMGDLDFEEAVSAFAEVVNAGKFGANAVLIETMSDTYELKAAVLAAKENCELPVFVTMIFDEKGRLLTGADIQTAVAMLEGLGVDALGFNCGLGPKQMLGLLGELREHTSLPIIVQPNAGLPESVNGKTVYNVTPEEFAQDMKKMAEMGVSYLGGCCGTTPEHIRQMIELCRDIPESVPEKKFRTLVSSYSKTVELGEKPVIIGERINPTGKKLLKEALRRNDIDYIIREGTEQTDAGAHILDVNVGLPEIDEPAMMEAAVYNLQAVLPTPLQIDTSDPEALERGLRVYNGKPLLNSVNGKEMSMRTVFPLAKKYGAAVVCLCLDENGIPETASGRIKIAKRIISTAKKYGITKNNLVIDPLTMTISTDKRNAVETLRAASYIKNYLEINTVLGVSNVSFGLPNRDTVNAAFFTLALENGLSAGIINPKSQAMMNAYYSFNALAGLDDNCAEYISSATATETVAPQSSLTLHTAIVKGLQSEAAQCAKELLEKESSLDVINNYIIPALDEVGAGFEANKLFLPQLLMSADSAKAAFDVIKETLMASGGEQESKGKIVLATVHGDIHDIGKNIVKVLLSNYGFEVIDLGKDVPEETVLKAVQDNGVRLVGLSALMTTTVPAMERTIKLLHEQTDAKVFVGGAVLTRHYAEMIDADRYAKDAMESVRIAQEFFNS